MDRFSCPGCTPENVLTVGSGRWMVLLQFSQRLGVPNLWDVTNGPFLKEDDQESTFYWWFSTIVLGPECNISS